jgi:hypothetical protein
MTILSDLAGLVGAEGTWTGTNGFRLMPLDELATLPAAMQVQTGARGNLLSLAYRWEHPSDGPQEGLLVVGLAGEEGRIASLWADSWHQQPTSMSLAGAVTAAGSIAVEGSYGEGWAWRITVEAPRDGHLHLRMDNVIPESQATDEIRAGAYPVMVMDLHRPDGGPTTVDS